MHKSLPVVLIVDDDSARTDYLRDVLVATNVQVEIAENGKAALAALAKNKYSLVVLDEYMPGMPGIDVLRKIRERHGRLELPVIMCTGDESHHKVASALEAGANDYVTKPFTRAVLKARVDTQVQLKLLHEDRLSRERLVALKAAVVTYNHEINNALAVAVGQVELFPMLLGLAEEKHQHLQLLKNALKRITRIVAGIKQTLSQGVPITEYLPGIAMLDLSDSLGDKDKDDEKKA